MRIPLLDLQQQMKSIKSDIMKKLGELMDTTSFIMGEEVTLLEKEFASFVGVSQAISCNSGTDALILILEAMKIGPGDEVITSPYSFFATAEAISKVGAVPVFVDVDAGTMNMDPAKLEAAVTMKTRAILPVHLFGQAADMEPIIAIAERHGLFVIEDACQAIGATYTFSDGSVKAVGAIGHAGAFSFYPTKNLGAYGDGGMMTTNDPKLAQIVKALRAHGSGMNGKRAYELLQDEVVELEVAGQSGTNTTIYDPTKYYNFLIGSNSRLDTMQAAILRIKLRHLDAWNQRRKELGKSYTEKLTTAGVISPATLTPQVMLPQADSVYHLYILICEQRDELAAYLGQQGIAVGIYYPVPLHLQKVYQLGPHRLQYHEGDLPVSEWLSKRTMAIPLFPELTEAEQDYIVEEIKKFYEERR